MTALDISCKVNNIMFGTAGWSTSEYESGLVLPIEGGTATALFERSSSRPGQFDMILRLTYILRYAPARDDIVRGLLGSGEDLLKATKTIQAHLESIHASLEALLRLVAGIRYLHWRDLPSWPSLFEGDTIPFLTEGVLWQLDGGAQRRARLPAKERSTELRPMFQPDNLLTPQKLEQMKLKSADHLVLDGDLLEILRVRDRAEGGSLRVAAIEATSLIEVVLRRYTFEALVKRGFSRTKLDGMKRDITLAVLLNAMVPLALEPQDLDSLRDHMTSIDSLRRERNKIIHENRPEASVNTGVVLSGIDAAVELIGHFMG